MTSSETLWPALSWPLCDGETMADEKTEELISRLEALRGTFESERMAAVNEAFIEWLKKDNGTKRGRGRPPKAPEPVQPQHEEVTEERYYTPEEAAKLLRLSTATIYRAIKNGRLKVRKIGQQYRIPKTELDNYGG